MSRYIAVYNKNRGIVSMRGTKKSKAKWFNTSPKKFLKKLHKEGYQVNIYDMKEKKYINKELY
jgi:hypothetical protein